MTVNIIKLCVGPNSIAELAKRQKQRLKEVKVLMHVTRQTPKRAADVLNNGSIYWVISGFVCVRQKLLELRPLDINGVSYCGLLLDKKLIRVEPRPRKPFQGWRYFETKDAPKDLIMKDVDMADETLRKLAALGLL